MSVSLSARPAAAEPRVGSLLAFLLPAAFSLYANFNGVQLVLAPERIEWLDSALKVERLAVLTTICAGTGMLGLSLGGAMSDATRGRFGRRAPWLAVMGVMSAILTITLGAQTTLSGVYLYCGVLWFTLNFFQAALLAAVPDRIPEARRPLASSVIGVSGPLGVVFGVNLAAALPIFYGHVALGCCLLATTSAYLIFAREPPSPVAPPAAHQSRLRALNLFHSFGHRDFALAFLFRVLMFSAQFSINNYLFYILQDHIGVADPGPASARFNAVRTAAILISVLVALWIANRVAKRRVFAQVYALIMAAAMLIPAFLPNWSGMLMFAALGGVASGVYAAIDMPLMSRVLPSPDSAGRDLAMLVMAGAAAQFLAPWIGESVIRIFGYDMLFIVAAFITLLSGLAISMVRRAP